MIGRIVRLTWPQNISEKDLTLFDESEPFPEKGLLFAGPWPSVRIRSADHSRRGFGGRRASAAHEMSGSIGAVGLGGIGLGRLLGAALVVAFECGCCDDKGSS